MVHRVQETQPQEDKDDYSKGEISYELVQLSGEWANRSPQIMEVINILQFIVCYTVQTTQLL